MPLPLDLSKWRNLPVQLLIGGLLVGLLGLAVSYKGGGVDFLFAYLTAFMFILSLGAGSLLLVIIHKETIRGYMCRSKLWWAEAGAS